MSATDPPVPVVILEPRRGWARWELRELWRYRELLYFLVWRDLKVRYKQTVLGAAWAVLQPLLTMVVFTVFFGKLAGVPSDGIPYPLFSYAGLLPWTFLSQGLAQSANSLVGSAHLITKVYFPRLIVPIAAVLTCAVDVAVAFAVLIGLLALYGIAPSPMSLLLLPLLALLAVVTVVGLGVWLAALSVEYRDFRHIVSFALQLGLFVSPVIYPSSIVVGRLARLGLPAWIYGLNPAVGLIEGLRWVLLGVGSEPWTLVATSAAVSLMMLVLGLSYFRNMERTFADVV